MAVHGHGRERLLHAVGSGRGAAPRDPARGPVHRGDPRHPPGARVRALHRGAASQGRRVAAVLHSAPAPLAVRDDGRRHPHAVGHPDAKGPLRHRRGRTPGGPRPGDPSLCLGGRPLAGAARRAHERGLAARRFAPHAPPRSLLRAAGPHGHRSHALARRVRRLGRDVRDDDQSASCGAARWGTRGLLALRTAAEPHRAVGAPVDARLLLRERGELLRRATFAPASASRTSDDT